MNKPLLDLKSIRVDMVYDEFNMSITVTHLPTGISATANGSGQWRLRNEAVVKIVENEIYREWLAAND